VVGCLLFVGACSLALSMTSHARRGASHRSCYACAGSKFVGQTPQMFLICLVRGILSQHCFPAESFFSYFPARQMIILSFYFAFLIAQQSSVRGWAVIAVPDFPDAGQPQQKQLQES